MKKGYAFDLQTIPLIATLVLTLSFGKTALIWNTKTFVTTGVGSLKTLWTISTAIEAMFFRCSKKTCESNYHQVSSVSHRYLKL